MEIIIYNALIGSSQHMDILILFSFLFRAAKNLSNKIRITCAFLSPVKFV